MAHPKKKVAKAKISFKDSVRFKELICLVKHCIKNSIDDLLRKLESDSEEEFFKKLEKLLKADDGITHNSILECVKSLSKNNSNPCNPYDSSKV